MHVLSLPEVEDFRALVLENAAELLEEAELLFKHKRFARCYALAHLSSEELAKLPLLAEVGVNLINGAAIDWKQLDRRLKSHEPKLRGLLVIDLVGTGEEPDAKDIRVHEQVLSRVHLFNSLKNVSLYAGMYQDSIGKPSGVITETLAAKALAASRNRLELFSTVEAVTHGRTAELVKNEKYIKLLNALGVCPDG